MQPNHEPPVTLEELIRVVLARNPEADALTHLADAVLVSQFLDEQADHLVGHFVDQARQAGASWTTIGQSMGVSKQAAQQRFVPPVDDELEVGRGKLFSRFTQRAGTAVAAAREEAQRLGSAQVAPEHLVLGLLHEPDGLAGQALAAQDVTLDRARAALGSGRARGGHPRFARETKKVLQLAVREALRLGHNYIGTEHLLLAVFRAGGSGTDLLKGLGVDEDVARRFIGDAVERLGRGR
jgi:hypothetical protein